MHPETRHNTAAAGDPRKRKASGTVMENVDAVNHSESQLRYESPVRNLQQQSSACVIRHSGYLDSLPVGYRFNPTDEELIKNYLLKKIKNESLPISKICEADIYEDHPKDVVGKYPQAIEDGWYFFTPRNRKYPNGVRPDRQAGSGYWKATGPDKVIKENEKKIGRRKLLVYYEGHAPHWTKTKWMMHEYLIEGYVRTRLNPKDNKLDDYVLCKIYINGKMKKALDPEQQALPLMSSQDVDPLSFYGENNVVLQHDPLVSNQDVNLTSFQVKNNLSIQGSTQTQHVNRSVENGATIRDQHAFMVSYDHNYQNMRSPYDQMLPYSRSHFSFPTSFNHQHSLQRPCRVPPKQPPTPRGLVHTVMYRSGLSSKPTTLPLLQEVGDCDDDSFVRHNIEPLYAQDGNGGFIGELISSSLIGNQSSTHGC